MFAFLTVPGFALWMPMAITDNTILFLSCFWIGAKGRRKNRKSLTYSFGGQSRLVPVL